MKALLIVTAAVEAGAGAAMLAFPSASVAILLGAPLDAPAGLVVGRVAAVALLALAVACWLARDGRGSPGATGLLAAMLLYNVGVVGVFAYAAIGWKLLGVAYWPAVGLHAALALWCISCLRIRTRKGI